MRADSWFGNELMSARRNFIVAQPDGEGPDLRISYPSLHMRVFRLNLFCSMDSREVAESCRYAVLRTTRGKGASRIAGDYDKRPRNLGRERDHGKASLVVTEVTLPGEYSYSPRRRQGRHVRIFRELVDTMSDPT